VTRAGPPDRGLPSACGGLPWAWPLTASETQNEPLPGGVSAAADHLLGVRVPNTHHRPPTSRLRPQRSMFLGRPLSHMAPMTGFCRTLAIPSPCHQARHRKPVTLCGSIQPNQAIDAGMCHLDVIPITLKWPVAGVDGSNPLAAQWERDGGSSLGLSRSVLVASPLCVAQASLPRQVGAGSLRYPDGVRKRAFRNNKFAGGGRPEQPDESGDAAMCHLDVIPITLKWPAARARGWNPFAAQRKRDDSSPLAF